MEDEVSVPKPFVQAACLCEKVLQEKDGVPSLIRVVDTYTMDEPSNLPPGYTLATQLTLFISLKSGDLSGIFEVGLRLHQPNEKSHPTQTWPIELKGQEHGANLIIQFSLNNPRVGLYWMDVMWGDEILTKIPFRLKFKEKAASVSQAQTNARTTS